MKTLETDRSRDTSTDEQTEAPRRRPDVIARKIMRKAESSASASAVESSGDDSAWSFGNAVNAGIHEGHARSGPDALVDRAAEGSGHAIPGGLRQKFEASLGTDLGGVRIHTHGAAQEASASLGARAYAVGQDVFMGAGQYNPDSPDGAWLMAHEVAHTVQQRGASSGPQTKLEVSESGDSMETEADSAATAMMLGQPATVGSSTGIARKIMPYRERIPWPQSSRWTAMSAGTHAVDVHAYGSITPNGGQIQRVAFTQPQSAVNVPAGTDGAIHISGTAHYEINDGTMLEPFPSMGDVTWSTLWHYTCTAEGALTLRVESSTSSNEPVGRTLIRNQPVVQVGSTADGSSCETPITISRGGASNPSVSVGPVGVGVPVGPTSTGAFQPRSPHLQLNVTGVHAPAPAPQPSASATASATADASASATATARVNMPVPTAVPIPAPHSIFFEHEGGMAGNRGDLVNWVQGLPDNVQAAIRTGRLQVTVIGFASTTGGEDANMDRFAAGRAAWVRRTLAQALGVPAARLQVGSRGEYTAPAAERAAPGGVADAHERRAEILCEPMNPTTMMTVEGGGFGGGAAVSGSSASARTGPP
jgi:hypothetical protein